MWTNTELVQYNYLPTMIASEGFLLLLIMFFIGYVNHIKSLLTLILTTNLMLFQGSLMFLSLLDNYSHKSLQLSCFNFFTSSLLSINQTNLLDPVSFGLDNVALVFILLTMCLTTYALIIGANTSNFGSLKFFMAMVLLIQFFLLMTFYTTSLFMFYMGFEGLTLPTFFLIFLFGAEKLKFSAAKLFLMYSFTSSALLSFAISLLYLQFQTASLNYLVVAFSSNKAGIITTMSQERYMFIFLLLFFAFGIKMPMAPFHMWLPEAHAEASTAGSVILAGLMLKLGGYGIMSYVLPFYSNFSVFYPYMQTTCLLSILMVTYSCFSVTNLKQMIAYTSIMHMNMTLLSLFSEQAITVAGGILSMCSHSLISSALFICAGILYSRGGTYEFQYFSGLKHSMPKFSFFFCLFILASIATPFTLGFVSEFVITSTFMTTNLYTTSALLLLLTLNSIFFLWILNRIMFSDSNAYGNMTTQSRISSWVDLTVEEFLLLFNLLLLVSWLGFNANILSLFLINNM